MMMIFISPVVPLSIGLPYINFGDLVGTEIHFIKNGNISKLTRKITFLQQNNLLSYVD